MAIHSVSWSNKLCVKVLKTLINEFSYLSKLNKSSISFLKIELFLKNKFSLLDYTSNFAGWI
jgi:hypothetical protein